MKTVQIHPDDNVVVQVETGHKSAIQHIELGEDIIKYGYTIGVATCEISVGELVHTHNMRTKLGEILRYDYQKIECKLKKKQEDSIMAYVRENGDIGIRNEVWIVNTVGCVNGLSEKLSRLTGAKSFPHPYGCSQLGKDHESTKLILKGLIEHPNAGGVLVLGLGCENNHIAGMKKILGDYNTDRVKFLVAQDCQDEIEQGVQLIRELQEYVSRFQREEVSISKLKVGLKCGGSDGLSGITANPLVGQFSDELIARGGSTVLTEVPEMFGAETILMNRCIQKTVFLKTVDLINDYKKYFIQNNQQIYENPSPGNKDGGISTLEDKSLGCIQKGGSAPVVDVLNYGDKVRTPGLNLLNGPGNDIVAITNLVAAGCHIVLFTTGRGTPVGAPVPTIKISSNTDLYNKKKSWIDYNAGEIIDGNELSKDFYNYVKRVVNGELTNNEKNGYYEIALFKEGVTL